VLGEYLEKLYEYPLVLGPAFDGGYYLIGYQKWQNSAALFENVTWSSPDVFFQTICNARESGVDYYVGKQYQDIDTVEDMRELCGHDSLTGLLSHLCALLRD
jgi:glycosyltransferase A (GT-A) superfamily protein (DUF2064 family)